MDRYTFEPQKTNIRREKDLYLDSEKFGEVVEIDHINGAVVAFGRRTATPTPYNEAMVRLIKAREALLARSRLRL